MAAVSTHILCISATPRDETDPVPAGHADSGMLDMQLPVTLRFQEGVAAVARTLAEAVPVGNHVHVMAEDAAAIPDFLVEDRRLAVGIVVGLEHERVAALNADVFAMAIAFDQVGVRVVTEKARERMPDVGKRAILAEVRGSAWTLATGGGLALLSKPVVIHLMAPDRAPVPAQPLAE